MAITLSQMNSTHFQIPLIQFMILFWLLQLFLHQLFFGVSSSLLLLDALLPTMLQSTPHKPPFSTSQSLRV